MFKKSWIRSVENGKKCPFGLPITLACKNAGDSVTHMCPFNIVQKNKQERIILANKKIYIYGKTNQRCLYAVNVMENPESVNCDFGDVGQGMGGASFSGSPLYAQTFAGVGLDGLYAFPLGFYADNSESRNLFQGLFSLLGSDNNYFIKKFALEEDKIWEKLESGASLTNNEFTRLENIIEEYRTEFEDNRTDPEKARELSDKWNPRKKL